jgi:hypothetical protein
MMKSRRVLEIVDGRQGDVRTLCGRRRRSPTAIESATLELVPKKETWTDMKVLP